jgi:nucleoside-diphosphate-sugar epimerase
MENKTALLTGAGGFTGRYMDAALRQRGYNVTGLESSGHSPCDLTNAQETLQAIQAARPDVVCILPRCRLLDTGTQRIFTA